MGVGPATWKKNRIEEEVERETAVRFRTLVVRNSILVLGLWPSCRVIKAGWGINDSLFICTLRIVKFPGNFLGQVF